MKNIIALAFLLLASQAFAQSYISTAGNMKIDAGTILEYDSPIITVNGTYTASIESYIVKLLFFDSNTFDFAVGEHTVPFTKAQVDAFTGTGTGDTEKWQNALEQCVVDYLEATNGAIFTIN